MVRLNKQAHQKLIEELFIEKRMSVDDILQKLQNEYGVTSKTKRALERRMQDWGIKRRAANWDNLDIPALRVRIAEDCYLHKMSDRSITSVLKLQGSFLNPRLVIKFQ